VSATRNFLCIYTQITKAYLKIPKRKIMERKIT